MIWNELTIATSCSRGYSQYLGDWAKSIREQSVKPMRVCIFTHGSTRDAEMGAAVVAQLTASGISAEWQNEPEQLDFGTARNRAIAMSSTEWVMHLDCDDTILPHAIADFQLIAPDADVIGAGYMLSGHASARMSRRERLYLDSTGIGALSMKSMASGVSPFRRRFWEQSPYRTDMFGAWDVALWIGFARLGARFRATKRAVFLYRQHPDSLFNTRRRTLGWTRALTTAQLKGLRRNYSGVDVIVPRDKAPQIDRDHVWSRVRSHYELHHPEWNIRVGQCPTKMWVKGSAIAHALSQSNAEVIVIADADCIVDPIALRSTVDSVQSGASWGMPHHLVYRANRQMTERYCAESADLLPALPELHLMDRPPYVGASGGGIVVIRRVMYDAVGGIPHAFRGWGSQDRALACLADTLLGPCVRGASDLIHLYHTAQDRRPTGPVSNLQLLRRLGHAAQQGKDALVSVVYTLPTTPVPLRMDLPVPYRLNSGALSHRRDEISAKQRRRIP